MMSQQGNRSKNRNQPPNPTTNCKGNDSVFERHLDTGLFAEGSIIIITAKEGLTIVAAAVGVSRLSVSHKIFRVLLYKANQGKYLPFVNKRPLSSIHKNKKIKSQ